MATLLGYGGQSYQTAVISLNYGVLFHIINISFAIKCTFQKMVRDFSGSLYNKVTRLNSAPPSFPEAFHF